MWASVDNVQSAPTHENPLLQHVYVINLDKDTKRLQNITENLNSYGVQFTRVPAIHGASLTQEELQKYTTPACRMFSCSKSIIGCALSHMKTWAIIAKAPPDTWHLVLEDDALFSDETIKKLTLLNTYIKKNNIQDALINIHCSNPYSFLCGTPTKDMNAPISYNLFAVGTAAYVLTPTIAQRLLRDSKGKVNEHIDAWLSLRYGNTSDIPYYVTKDRYIINNYESTTSGNIQSIPPMPLLAMCLRRMELHEIEFILNVTLFSIGMKFEVNLYTLILLSLILMNVFFLHSTLIYIYITIEISVVAILYVHKKERFININNISDNTHYIDTCSIV